MCNGNSGSADGVVSMANDDRGMDTYPMQIYDVEITIAFRKRINLAYPDDVNISDIPPEKRPVEVLLNMLTRAGVIDAARNRGIEAEVVAVKEIKK